MPTILTITLSTPLGNLTFLEDLDPSTGAAVSGNGTHLLRADRIGGTGGQVFYHQFGGASYGSSLQTIELAAPAGGDLFGMAMTIDEDGDVAAISARGQDDQGSQSGDVYIYTRSGTTWTQQTTLTLTGHGADHEVGDENRLDISNDGTYVITSSTRTDFGGSNTGRVWIHSGSGASWSEQANFDGPSSNANLGFSVAMAGDGLRAAAAAPRSGSNAGSVYVWSRSGSTWSQEQIITPSDAKANQYFGGHSSTVARRVALSEDGSVLVVGAPLDYITSAGDDDGAVYVFTRSGTTWTQSQKIVPDTRVDDQQFGMGVDMTDDGSTIIISDANGDAFTYADNEGTYELDQTLSPFGSQTVRLSGNGEVAVDEQTRIYRR